MCCCACCPQITAWLEQQGLGNRKVNYKLRDWLFARQRYWGEPFPLMFPEGSDTPGEARQGRCCCRRV